MMSASCSIPLKVLFAPNQSSSTSNSKQPPTTSGQSLPSASSLAHGSGQGNSFSQAMTASAQALAQQPNPPAANAATGNVPLGSTSWTWDTLKPWSAWLFKVLLAILGLVATYVALSLAAWTSIKDLRDDCRSQNTTLGIVTPKCQSALAKPLADPPLSSWFDGKHKRWLLDAPVHVSPVGSAHSARLVLLPVAALALAMAILLVAYWRPVSALLFFGDQRRLAGSHGRRPIPVDTTSFTSTRVNNVIPRSTLFWLTEEASTDSSTTLRRRQRLQSEITSLEGEWEPAGLSAVKGDESLTGTDLASIDTKRTFLDGDHAARNARLDAFHATQTFSDVNPTASVVPISVDAAHSQHRLLSWPKRNQRRAASSLSARSKLAGDYPELPWKPSRNESDGDSETSSPRAARCPLSEDDDFETVCLKTHINRKLELEEGRWNNEAEASLIKLIEAGRNDPSKNNTHLLWIRLTLAFAMRAHEKEALAMRLFTGLVEPASGKSKAKLESPHHLHVAEMALKLLREGRWEESRDLPQSHGLRWVRQEVLDVLEQTDEISAISEDNRYEWGMRTGSVRPGR